MLRCYDILSSIPSSPVAVFELECFSSVNKTDMGNEFPHFLLASFYFSNVGAFGKVITVELVLLSAGTFCTSFSKVPKQFTQKNFRPTNPTQTGNGQLFFCLNLSYHTVKQKKMTPSIIRNLTGRGNNGANKITVETQP